MPKNLRRPSVPVRREIIAQYEYFRDHEETAEVIDWTVATGIFANHLTARHAASCLLQLLIAQAEELPRRRPFVLTHGAVFRMYLAFALYHHHDFSFWCQKSFGGTHHFVRYGDLPWWTRAGLYPYLLPGYLYTDRCTRRHFGSDYHPMFHIEEYWGDNGSAPAGIMWPRLTASESTKTDFGSMRRLGQAWLHQT